VTRSPARRYEPPDGPGHGSGALDGEEVPGSLEQLQRSIERCGGALRVIDREQRVAIAPRHDRWQWPGPPLPRSARRSRVDPLQETIDYVAIERLVAAYADVVTRRAWGELDDLFVAGAPVRIDTVTRPVVEVEGAAALGEFIAGAIERYELFEFVVLNRVVEVATAGPDAARGRLYMCELRQDRDTGHASTAFGVYHDDYRRAGGRWRFARRDYRSLARTGRREVFPFPEPPPHWRIH
jgi:hypothetical protein